MHTPRLSYVASLAYDIVWHPMKFAACEYDQGFIFLKMWSRLKGVGVKYNGGIFSPCRSDPIK